MKKLIIILFLLSTVVGFTQTYTMQNGSVTTCSGVFYDSGGLGGNYSNNENFVFTICPTNSSDAIQLDFSSFDIEGGTDDFLVIYNGDNTSQVSLGTFTSNPGIITANNATGCLTIEFVSDTFTSLSGWEASISCIAPCQSIVAQLDNVSRTVNADNVIELCIGDSFTVEGSGIFSNSSVGATYEWDFGDGTTVSTLTASHSYPNAGIYIINLNITDASPEACTNTNYINLIAHVYGPPIFSSLTNTSFCAGIDNDILVSATGNAMQTNCSPPVVGTTFLPDGNGAEYTTCIDVTCYGTGETVSSIDDIVDICLNIEHSYFGDLDIIIEAPNGQSAVLVDYDLITNSSIYLGEALDHIVTATDVALGPGVGYDYCFSMTGSVTLNNAPEVNGGDALASGTYLPDESFASLIGAPLNGQWCIRVRDNLLSDNGYIFSWDINFENELDPNQNIQSDFTQTIVSESWQSHSDIISSANGGLTFNSSSTGNQCFTYEVTDNIGCTYTQDYCLDFVSCSNNIDFDGVDDFINTPAFLGGYTEATLMSWIKLDTNFDGGDVMGQRNFRLYLDSNNRLKSFIRTNSGAVNNITTPNVNAPILTPNLWYHITAVYDGNIGSIQLIVNGQEIWQQNNLTGNFLNSSSGWNANYDFTIGRNASNYNNHFEGSIYETRVYNKALTITQIQEQVYQQIQSFGGLVSGVSVPKTIDNGSLSWNDLQLYYKMDAVLGDGTTPDSSLAGRNGLTNNMTTIQDRSAPIPYIADATGNWIDPACWKYGDLWDITNLPHEDWAIVHIKDNTKITTNNSHIYLGLIIDSGSELEVLNDQLITNTSYLKLDGVLDLVGEAQLIQTEESILDPVSSGVLERDQQGKSDVYSYNYWSSPVSTQNNVSVNYGYSLTSVLRDGTDPNNIQPITFTNAYDGSPSTPIMVSDFWIYKYVNQPDDYQNWTYVGSTGTIMAGEGYTQKGTGTSNTVQNYTFEGKPNNGDINLSVNANNLYLVGNPYPSAIDANQFILDNGGTIETNGDFINSGTTTGALYFWEHWGGGSHVLADYQGGYATYNLAGATLAIPDPEVSNIGAGSVLPKRYIPIGQGFVIQGGSSGGTIEFNNGQRVFERESDGNSVFISTNLSNNATPRLINLEITEDNSSEEVNNFDEIKRIFFKFKTPEGPERQLLLAVKNGLTEGVDYGYDAKLIDQQVSDGAWLLNNEKYVIQSIGEIYSDLELPLYVKSDEGGIGEFMLESLDFYFNNQEVYFIDKLKDVSIKLAENISYSFEIDPGIYVDRFYIRFSENKKIVSSIEEELNELEELVIYYLSTGNQVVIECNSDFSANGIVLYDLLGKEVIRSTKDYNQVKKITFPAVLEKGVYLLKLVRDENKEVSKKIIVN